MIHIAGKLSEKRKERGITQEELASFMGVSKASVSKWETGQSYPDIAILPQLASYFNISIDELMGYEPQLEKGEIRRLYSRLASAFSLKPFGEVYEECREIIRKYYSCFPLLLNMANLLLNHFALAPDPETGRGLLEEIIKLSIRVKEGSRDIFLIRQANVLEATGYLEMGEPKKALALLQDTVMPILGEEILLSCAYEQTAQRDKAVETLQIDMYQKVIGLIADAQKFLMLHMHEEEAFRETVQRMAAVSDCFRLDQLHPMTMGNLYYVAALGFLSQESREEALDMLERFAEVWIQTELPVRLHGDGYFDKLDGWFKEFDLGDQAPLNDTVIKKSLLEALSPESGVGELAGDPRFELLVRRMKNKLE